MDSLLASYASSDEDADETLPSAAPAASRRGGASAKPSGGIFTALPQAKSAPLFSSLPTPQSDPSFSSLTPPKSSAASSGKPKRVVQFRPPPIRQPTGDSSDEEEQEAEKRRRSSATEARPPQPAGSGPVSSFLPAPRHSLGLGLGAGRRSSIDTAAPERSNLGTAVPSNAASNTWAPERPNAGAPKDEGDSAESSDEGHIPASGEEQEQLQQQQQGSDGGAGYQQQLGYDAHAEAGYQQQHGYDAGVGNTTGYEGYAWETNYYANYAANPSGNVDYAVQYEAYGGEQAAGYGTTYEVYHGEGYVQSTPVPYGGDYTGGYRPEGPAISAPPMQEPVLPPEVGRIGGKRGRKDMPMEILEVNQAELMKNRPREDKSKLTGVAFGPSYQAAPSTTKGKPSKLHKRKHQIGTLYYDMKQKEMELSERRSKGLLTKAETQAKYGW